ncbi:MAG: hypothetical protein QME05_06790 [Candidatus Margulisbacteria bacterium]|nr:hypothetical protein [Candidatus Margulisiibacteriota bacterium]
MKIFNLLVIVFFVLASVGFAMSQPSSQLPSLDSLSDTYAVFDKKAAFSSIQNFALGSPARSDDELEARQQIINDLTQLGYTYNDRIIPGSNQLIILFSLTNEVRSVNIYTDEKGYKQTALIYKDFYQEIGPFSSTLADPSFKGLTRKETVVRPVQAITIWVYYFSNVNSLKEVWESGASSLQGGKLGIDDLAQKALVKFPVQAKKKG